MNGNLFPGIKAISRDNRGSTIAEFALVLPIWLLIVFGMLSLTRIYWVRSGVLNGLGNAAREATVWPQRTEADIQAAFDSSVFGLLPGEEVDLTITPGSANGENFVDLEASLTPQIFVTFVPIPAVTLTYQRRAYIPQS